MSNEAAEDGPKLLHGARRPEGAIRHDGGVKGAVLRGIWQSGDSRNDAGEDGFGGGDVRMEVGDDGFGCHGLLLDLPAIVIGDHRQRGEGDLRLAGQLGLRQVRHADDIEAELAVRVRFRPRGEGWPIHADVGAAVVDAEAQGLAFLMQKRAQARGNRIAEGHMGHDAAPEEGVMLTAARAIEKLVRQQHITRMVLLLQAAHGCHGNDPAHVQAAQRPDIGPVIQLGGQEAMPFAMPGQENDPPTGEITRDERVAGRAKGRGDADFLPVGESVEVVEAGAADDANGRWRVSHAAARVKRRRQGSNISLLEKPPWDEHRIRKGRPTTVVLTMN